MHLFVIEENLGGFPVYHDVACDWFRYEEIEARHCVVLSVLDSPLIHELLASSGGYFVCSFGMLPPGRKNFPDEEKIVEVQECMMPCHSLELRNAVISQFEMPKAVEPPAPVKGVGKRRGDRRRDRSKNRTKSELKHITLKVRK